MSRDRIDLLLMQKDFSWDKEEWFPPLAAALEGVGPAEAAWQPPGGGNTIWQTVNHLNYYNDRVLTRITGATPGTALPDNDATFGGPGNPEDAAGWQATLEEARRIAADLRQAIADLTDADLDKSLSSGTLGQLLPAWVLHEAYHGGQIVLIRKQQGSWPARRG